MTERRDMEAVIEAILFVSNDPVSRGKLLEVFADDEAESATQAIDAVVERYQANPDSGIRIDEVAGGLRLVSRPDLHGYLRRFFEVTGTNKLTMPGLETLAIIAYRQPVTSPEIQELRGVNSSGVLKKLLERRLVRIAGRKEVVGKPFLYTTTREFLMHFGLRSLKELPPLEQFEELFGGDSEATAEPKETDHEEQVLIEAAHLEDEASDAEEQRVEDEIEQEREEAELLEALSEPPPDTLPDSVTEVSSGDSDSGDSDSGNSGIDSASNSDGEEDPSIELDDEPSDLGDHTAEDDDASAATEATASEETADEQ